MSGKVSKSKTTKSKSVVNDFAPPADDLTQSIADISQTASHKTRVSKSAVSSKNEVIKSKLSTAIDLLSPDNSSDELKEKMIMHNVSLALKYLKEAVGML